MWLGTGDGRSRGLEPSGEQNGLTGLQPISKAARISWPSGKGLSFVAQPKPTSGGH